MPPSLNKLREPRHLALIPSCLSIDLMIESGEGLLARYEQNQAAASFILNGSHEHRLTNGRPA